MTDGKPGPPSHAKQVGLPPRPFLYTLDQISVMTDLPETALKAKHIYFEGRSIGTKTPHQMSARNMNADNPAVKPDWRILDKEFVRWMRVKGFKYYDGGTFRS